MPDRAENRPSQTEQTGLSSVENFFVNAAKSRWARGAAVVLGFGAGSAVVADYLIQNPVVAQVEQGELTPTLTPTPLPVIATAEAQRAQAVKMAGERRTRITKETAIAEATSTAKAQATAIENSARATATAIIAQARKDYPEWAADEDAFKVRDGLAHDVGMGMVMIVVIGIAVYFADKHWYHE